MTPKMASKRKPTKEEVQAAVLLAQRFVMDDVPEPDLDIIHSRTPPGRIDMRQRMVRKYEQERKIGSDRSVALQYMRAELTDTSSQRKKVAIACDFSGSMGEAQEILGSTRYVLTNALERVGGEVAAVLFGEQAWPIQSPGDRLPNVEVYEASDRYERYEDAFWLLDARLDLIDGDGVRMLVLFTDGHFNKTESVKWAEISMDMCRAAGVGVLWVNVSGYVARKDCYGYGTLVDAHSAASPVEVAKRIGSAYADEYRRIAWGGR